LGFLNISVFPQQLFLPVVSALLVVASDSGGIVEQVEEVVVDCDI